MLSFSNCVENFNWMMIYEQSGLPPQIDGILGLTQGRTPAGSSQDLPEDYSVGPLWLDHIYDYDYITEPQFSTHFEGFSGSSYIDFGPVQDQGLSDRSQTKTIQCDAGFFYSAIPMGVRFGNVVGENSYALENSPAIFSSSSSVSFVPRSVSKLFFEKLLKGIRYVNEDNGVYYAECSVRPNDVFMMFDNRWVQISGDDMVIDISPNQDMSLCIINFLPSVDDYWVLGNSIYKDYYVTHIPDTH